MIHSRNKGFFSIAIAFFLSLVGVTKNLTDKQSDRSTESSLHQGNYQHDRPKDEFEFISMTDSDEPDEEVSTDDFNVLDDTPDEEFEIISPAIVYKKPSNIHVKKNPEIFYNNLTKNKKSNMVSLVSKSAYNLNKDKENALDALLAYAHRVGPGEKPSYLTAELYIRANLEDGFFTPLYAGARPDEVSTPGYIDRDGHAAMVHQYDDSDATWTRTGSVSNTYLETHLRSVLANNPDLKTIQMGWAMTDSKHYNTVQYKVREGKIIEATLIESLVRLPGSTLFKDQGFDKMRKISEKFGADILDEKFYVNKIHLNAQLNNYDCLRYTAVNTVLLGLGQTTPEQLKDIDQKTYINLLNDFEVRESFIVFDDE